MKKLLIKLQKLNINQLLDLYVDLFSIRFNKEDNFYNEEEFMKTHTCTDNCYCPLNCYLDEYKRDEDNENIKDCRATYVKENIEGNSRIYKTWQSFSDYMLSSFSEDIYYTEYILEVREPYYIRCLYSFHVMLKKNNNWELMKKIHKEFYYECEKKENKNNLLEETIYEKLINTLIIYFDNFPEDIVLLDNYSIT